MAASDSQLAIPLSVPIDIGEFGIRHDGVEASSELSRGVSLDLPRGFQIVLLRGQGGLHDALQVGVVAASLVSSFLGVGLLASVVFGLLGVVRLGRLGG